MPREKKSKSIPKTPPKRRLSVYREEYKIMIDLLRDVREKAGLRQEDVAEKLGVLQTFVSKIETSDRRLDIIELRDMCAVYEVELKEFLDMLEERLQVDATNAPEPLPASLQVNQTTNNVVTKPKV